MQLLSNYELNKLKNVECTLEKGLRNVIERFNEHDPHFGPDILECLDNAGKSRCQEKQILKKGIQNIAQCLWSKLELLKKDQIGDIKDFKKFKQEMVDIQENIFNTKTAAKLEIKKLIKTQDDLNDELNIYYNGKVSEWNEPLNVNMSCEFIPARVKSKNTGQCKEVKQFFDFVHQSNGHENGWRKDDHLLFLKFRAKYKRIDVAAFHLHQILPDISIEEIESHEDWYKKYLNLQAKKKEAIYRWKQNKRNKSLSKNLGEVENSKYNVKCKDDGMKLREKLMEWKTDKEEKLARDKEFEKQQLLDKIEKERVEKQRQIQIKNIVNEWRESKVILEQTKRQNKRMFEAMERKRRSALANKLIKQFQSVDELHILKMRQTHKKLTEEQPRRVQSGPPALRDPKRLMQPTEQWAQRVRAIRDPTVPIFKAPKLGIPYWRKGIS